MLLSCVYCQVRMTYVENSLPLEMLCRIRRLMSLPLPRLPKDGRLKAPPLRPQRLQRRLGYFWQPIGLPSNSAFC